MSFAAARNHHILHLSAALVSVLCFSPMLCCSPGTHSHFPEDTTLADSLPSQFTPL